MTTTRRRWWAAAAVTAAAALVLSACGSSTGDSTPTSAAQSTDTGSADSGGTATDDAAADDTATDDTATDDAATDDTATGDHNFIYITNNPIGINEFLGLGKKGIEDAAAKFGGTGKTYESTDQASQRSNLEAAIDEAPDVIVLITFDFTDMAKEYADANPDQQFVLIDDCPADPPANLHCAVFREQEASYLLGVEAGMLTEAKKVGSVVSIDIPFLHRYSDTFALAAQAQDPSITDTQLFIGGDNPFADPASAKERALDMASKGVDHVFAVGAGSNGGVMEAAVEKGFFAYGVDVNQCPLGPGHVVDNTVKRVDTLVVSEIGKILDGTAESVTSYGLAEGGMTITSLTDDAADSGCVIMDHPDILAKVKETQQQIIDGTLSIPDPIAAG